MYKFNREQVESGLFTVMVSALSNKTKENILSYIYIIYMIIYDNICSILLYLLFNSVSVNSHLVLDIIPA